jgi:uncharacterized protein YoaH (UPF0181 family)
MTTKYWRVLSLAAMATTLMTLGGCATQEAVEHAQSTANQALSTGQAAQQAAANAQAAASQAQQTASQALGAAQNAQQSADRANSAVGAVEQKLQAHEADTTKHRGPRG